jgi:nucleotide-binding universal stress UspA family protein
MLAIKNILVPTDFGDAADTALTYGRELATRFGATLHLVHVVDNIQISAFPEAYGEVAARMQDDLEAAAWREIKKRLIDSDHSGPRTAGAVITAIGPVVAIVDYAKKHKVDLIVMGTHGRGALAHFMMGSIAERVVRIAPCPVLTVRHREHEFVWPDALVAVAKA